tara:strand:- start:2848 stop:4650 length:1803 start_codon:yes stop_codon:yes gene_type:complete
MKNKSDLSIVNLSTYTSPAVKEVGNKQWVSYGDDNNYFQYLIDRYNGSPTNSAVINGISEMIFGKGLDATNSNSKPNEYAQMMSLFNKSCIRKLCYDLKLMGQCAIQIIYSKDRTKIVQIEHIPIETLRAEKCNDKGEIEAYYYSSDWQKYNKSNQIKRIPAFGFSKEGLEIMYIKPYRAGFKYYSPVDYQGGTQYAELEEEISNYHLNNILNGLAPSMLINFNNGTPDPEQREMIERRIYEKFSGSSNAGKFILAFNDNPETSASIDPIQLSDAHNQYQFLSDESSKKIMVAHRVVSPMLFGIKDNTGLGNNADELKTASILFDNLVIKGFQNLLIEGFDQILAYNEISLHLYFKTLQPLEFTELDNVVDAETREEETGVKLSKESNKLLEEFIGKGQDESELLGEYNLIDEMDVDYDLEDELDKKIEELNNEVKLASVAKATPYQESVQDGKSYKADKQDITFLVRYMYTAYSNSYKTERGRSREFCIKMMRANKVYRKEDIIALDNIAVNPGFGQNGNDTYSVWLYKGGARCSHRWTRKIYARKDGDKGLGDTISTTRARKEGFNPASNEASVSIAPRNMTYAGYTASYWNKMGFTN